MAASLSSVPSVIADRIFARSVVAGTGCIESTYSLGSHGYPQIGWSVDGRRFCMTIHRVAWLAARGPIAPGLVVDHICFNRRCLDLTHLRLLKRAANAARQQRHLAPLCPHGHERAIWDRWRANGVRYCLACYDARLQLRKDQRAHKQEL